MAVVNRVPRGLLGLLDAKTQGQTPADTTGVLAPVIDLTSNYLADIPFQTAQASALGTSTGVNLGVVTVPNGELWYVYVVSAEGIQTVAAQTFSVTPVLVAPSGTISVPLVTGDFALAGGATIGDSNVRVFAAAVPLLIGPGSQFATRLLRDPGAGNINCVTSVVYRSVTV